MKDLDVEAAVIDLYKQGVNVTEIMDRVALSSYAIYAILDRHGVKRRNKDRARETSENVKAEAQNLYNEGTLAKDIAERLSLSLATVYNILHLEAHKRNGIDNEIVNMVIQMRRQGHTMRKIGEALGISRTSVLNIIKASNGEGNR